MAQKEGPALMEVDQARSQNSLLRICYRCKKSGHYAQECPLSFDIQTMRIRLELLPELLILADTSGAPSLETKRSVGVEETLEEEEEGFGAHSG